ncbi:SDR family NAD(P)-dependent oxidoreductase [Amycolatopsis sp. NPDC051903]|uniref:SDR family NAD(P)-dependent oxidoreductase n=1 Tax=Amycolatopsis sp. NPDC051903 TaxID=3363936 RepID=UPI0037A7AD8F
MGSFVGKTAIVTGGARGIGERVAEDIVAQGGNVIVGNVNSDLGENLVSRLGPTNARFVDLNVTRRADSERAVELAQSTFGGLDFLVNAAVAMDAKPLIELSETGWRKTMDVGLTGTFLTAQVFAAHLIQQGRPGSIVNISSIGGQHPYGGAGSYSTVKAGVTLLTEQMAIEWAQHGIRVNAVAPGTIETPLTTYLDDPEIRESRRQAVPLGRIGQPADISHGVLYLLSGSASWVTATTLTVDGGVTRSLFNHMTGRKWS